MSERAKKLMSEIWTERDKWADTEEKLVSVIILKSIEHVRTLTASQMNLTVLDKDDMIRLSEEIQSLS